jgi:hypothetical protein
MHAHENWKRIRMRLVLPSELFFFCMLSEAGGMQSLFPMHLSKPCIPSSILGAKLLSGCRCHLNLLQLHNNRPPRLIKRMKSLDVHFTLILTLFSSLSQLPIDSFSLRACYRGNFAQLRYVLTM